MIDGKRFSGIAPSKTAAQQELSKLIADATRGGVVDPSAETVEQYLTRWLEAKKSSRAQRTHDIQAGHLRRDIAPVIGNKRLQKLSPADLRTLFDKLNAHNLGASSQRQIHQFLLTALGEAAGLEIISRNVATLVKPNPPKRNTEGELAAFTPEEAAAFLQAARADHRGAWFEFALSTGMRRGEICGLRWTDLNVKAGTIVVSENVIDSNGKVVVSAPKTRGSRRTVHLSSDVLALLERVKAQQNQERLMLREKWRESGRIFTNSLGGTLLPNNMKRDMARICEAAGVRRLPVHGLRHTYASVSLKRGMPVEVVSKQLGHASVAFTLAQYRTVYQGERESWALNMDDMLPAPKARVD
ncbi:tyrosine-type recombinase/integrase [Deinococcus irradiatisoli]|nr:site-specific integrase [Deinococcus irradiatisoli]